MRKASTKSGLDYAAKLVIDAVDAPKREKQPIKDSRLYIQVVPDDADEWRKRAFLCCEGVDGNLCEFFETKNHSLRDVVEAMSSMLDVPVNFG